MDLSMNGALSKSANKENELEYEHRFKAAQFSHENSQPHWWYDAWDPSEFNVDFYTVPYTAPAYKYKADPRRRFTF